MKPSTTMIVFVLGLACAPPVGAEATTGADTGLHFLGDVEITEAGRSDPIVVAWPSAAVGVGVRVSTALPDDPASSCLTVEEVALDEMTVVPRPDPNRDYGPFCRTCSQRVSVHPRHGWFAVLADRDHPPEELAFRVAIRECETLTPAEVLFGDPIPERVAVAWRALRPTAEPRLRLRVLALAGSRLFGHELAEDPLLAAAVTEAARIMREAGIALELVGRHSVPLAPPHTLAVSRSHADQLERVHGAVRSELGDAVGPDGGHEVWLVLARCLVRPDPVRGYEEQLEGFAPRIPGGLRPDGAPGAVYVRDGSCSDEDRGYWLDGRMFGRVIAHELGHYLGLYHTVEADGTPDALPDTTGDNVMHHRPLAVEQPRWTEMQRAVMTVHPVLTPTARDASDGRHEFDHGPQRSSTHTG